MKNLYVLITISIAVCSTSLNAQWMQTDVPSVGASANIVSINGNSLYVVSYFGQGGFWVSTDEGTTWTPIGANFVGERGPFSLAGNGTDIYAGTFITGNPLYLSTNNGIDWAPMNSFPSPHWIQALAVSGEKILVGTMGGSVYLSTDNGIDWTTSILDSSVSISSFIISDTNIFSGTYNAGVFISSDNGGNWTPVNNGLNDTIVNALASNGNNIFSGTDSNGVFLSTDNGTNWAQVNNGLNSLSINAFAVSGNNIFAGTGSDGVYLTTNNGTSWTEVNDGLTNRDVFSLAVDKNNIFAGTGEGLFRRPLTEILTGVEDQGIKIPNQFILEQNYPNPFNPSTSIQYSLSSMQFVTLKIYDVLGNEVTTLVNEEKPVGTYELNWNAVNLPSGVYFYRLQAGNFVQTRKMILMK